MQWHTGCNRDLTVAFRRFATATCLAIALAVGNAPIGYGQEAETAPPATGEVQPAVADAADTPVDVAPVAIEEAEDSSRSETVSPVDEPATEASAIDLSATAQADAESAPIVGAAGGADGASAADDAADEAALVTPAWRLLSPPYTAETPLPASGKAMYYNPGVMKTVIESRTRFAHIEPCEECIGYVAMLRYGDVDRKVWLQLSPLRVEGPFHVVDAAATQHVGMLIEREWVIDVDYKTAQRWGFRMPWVTVWDEPPLDLLLATDAIPLDWETCRLPTSAFVRSPHSVSVPDAVMEVHPRALKNGIELRHLGATDFVDAMSDTPDYLYVK
jgi:hypothetical protein